MTDTIRGTDTMKMERSFWIWALTAALAFPCGRGGAKTASGPAKTPVLLQLRTPEAGRRIQNSTILFSWNVAGGDSVFRSRRFDLQIWDKKKRFKRTLTVESKDTTGYGQIYVFDSRHVFKRHGKYYWKVIAVDSAGSQVVSGTGAFVIPAPRLESSLGQPLFPFSVRYQYNPWSDFNGYQSFIRTVYPRTQLQSYSDVSLGFHQSWGATFRYELQERMLLLSQIGLGAELIPRVRLMRNAFVAITAWGRGKQCWYSTGLENYASTMTEAAIGCEFAVMPGGSLAVSGAWIPLQRVRYGLLGGGLRTLDGSGFETGVRLTIPRSLLSTIRVLGFDLDFQRIPISIGFGRIKDGYSGIRLDFRRFTVEYLF
jgi:hypothetical protein